MGNMFSMGPTTQPKTAKPRIKQEVGAFYVVALRPYDLGGEPGKPITRWYEDTSKMFKTQVAACRFMSQAPWKAWVMDYNTKRPVSCKGFLGGLDELLGTLKL